MMKAYARTDPVEEPLSLGRVAVFEDFGLAFAGASTVEKWIVFSTFP